MGVCHSSNRKVKDDKAKNEKKINKYELVRKLLILGAGESGKSTVLKQMRLLHGDGFSIDERNQRKAVIYNNVITEMAAILAAMEELSIEFEDTSLQVQARLLLGVVEADKSMEPLTVDMVAAVKALWADAGVQRSYDRRANYQFSDCAKFFIEAIDRITANDYTPTVQDMLHSRVPTTGVVQIDFVVQKIQFRVFDVGGQRSERKKWLCCFEDVHAILYIAAISEYDLKLREDNKTNRLVEAIRLFASVCNSPYFTRTSMLIFLNKTDLFREKIEKANVPLTVCFQHFRGEERSYDEAVEYIREQFLAQQQTPSAKASPAYVHETCATDCGQMQAVVDMIIDIIVQKNIAKLTTM